MIAVAAQPIDFKYVEITSFPITFRLEAMTMMTAISGAATMPVENRGPVKSLYWIDMHEIQRKTDKGRNCNG